MRIFGLNKAIYLIIRQVMPLQVLYIKIFFCKKLMDTDLPDIKLLLFLPAKDESKTIAAVIETAKNVLKTMSLQSDILVIDDGSEDTTGIIAKNAGAIVLRNHQNKGLGLTFQRAVSFAIEKKYDFMVTMDADNQFSPEEIPNLLLPALAQKDIAMVTGSRFLEASNLKNMPKIKFWGNHLMSGLINSILQTNYSDVSCGFRVYSREALLHLNLFGKFTYTQEVFLNLGYKQKSIIEIPITVSYFKERKSRIAHNLFQYAKRTFSIIFYSVLYYKPFRLLGFISLLLGIPGLSIVLFTGIRFLVTGILTPFRGLAIIGIGLLSLSFLTFIIGLILHMISRIYLNVDNLLYYEKRNAS
jgi:glycosyltransferase involved in cell wall biosynthesis